MTWALAKMCKAFALAVSLRNSLKLLKGLSSKKKTVTEAGYGVLMFWAIFGFFILWEQYFEYFVRWIPTYYYMKSFFIVLMAYPQLRFTNFIFVNGIVYCIECLHDSFGDMNHLSAAGIALLIPMNVVMFVFPMHITKPVVSRRGNDETAPFDIEDRSLSIDLSESIKGDDGAGELDMYGGEVSSATDSAADVAMTEYNEKHPSEVYRADMSYATPPSTPRRGAKGQAHVPSSPDSDTPPADCSGARKEYMAGGRPSIYRRSSSMVMDGVRGLLTGDSHIRLTDTVFNLDLHSPSPNALYRQTHPSLAGKVQDSINSRGNGTASVRKDPPSCRSVGTDGEKKPFREEESKANDKSIRTSRGDTASVPSTPRHITRGSSRSRVLTPGVDFDLAELDEDHTTEFVFRRLRRKVYETDRVMADKKGGGITASSGGDKSIEGVSKGRRPSGSRRGVPTRSALTNAPKDVQNTTRTKLRDVKASSSMSCTPTSDELDADAKYVTRRAVKSRTTAHKICKY